MVENARHPRFFGTPPIVRFGGMACADMRRYRKDTFTLIEPASISGRGQRDGKRGSLAGLAGGLDLAAVHFDKGFDESQA